ncbi:hypothetical protein IJ541_11035 [bacterium]|nr:hypothetical protein [bacterium]
MNIDSIKNYPTGSSAKFKHKSRNVLEYKQQSELLCAEGKSVNRGYYGGSFTGINRAAASISQDLADVAADVVKDNWFDKILKLCEKHTVIAQNLVALVLASVFRPAAIMSLPGKKDKEDKMYASGHAIASGVIGFGFSSIVMYPLGQAVEKSKQNVSEVATAPFLERDLSTMENKKEAKKLARKIKKLREKFNVNTTAELIDKIKEKYHVSDLKDLENVELFKKFKQIYKVENLTKLEQSHAFKMTTKALDMAPDVFIFGIAKAMLTVALIPPILKYGFGLEKKKKVEQASVQNPAQVSMTSSIVEKPEISKFAGGLK